MRTEVVCLRHAESANLVAGVSGAVPVAPLTARGFRQAAAVAAALAGIDRVYASSALRARQTAAALGVEVVARDELVEIGLGGQEGSTDPALRRETADVLRAWVVDGELDRRVADGESGHEVLARMTAGLREVAAFDGRAALVGHVGSLTLAVSVLCGLGAEVWGRPLPPAVPFGIGWDGRRSHCPQWPA